MNNTHTEHRIFLLHCAAWQDTLLQSYRSLHVIIQGFLVATGAAVFAVQLTGAIQEQHVYALSTVFNLLFTALLAFLFWLQRKTSTELKEVVQSRAMDINHWHKHIILSENAFKPDQRAFTYFKMWQHAKRASVEHVLPQFLPEGGISEENAVLLIGKGLGHTRKVLDVNLFQRMQYLWYAILVASFGVTVWSLALWWLVRAAE